jgi:excisionase family DNA binding protein
MNITAEQVRDIIKEALQENKPEEPKLTLTIDEAAKLSGIGRNKMIELTYKPDFPAFKVGSKTLINKDRFIAWLNEITVQRQTI